MDTRTGTTTLLILAMWQHCGLADSHYERCVTNEGFPGLCSSKTMCPREVKRLMAGQSVTLCPYDSVSYKLCCPTPHDNDVTSHQDPLSCITMEGQLGVCTPKARCRREIEKKLRIGGDVTMCPRNLFPSSRVCCPLSQNV